MAKDLNRFGEMILDNLQSDHPGMYADLKASGKLESFLNSQQDQMAKQFGNLLQKGFGEDQAMEMLRPDFIQENQEDSEPEDETSRELKALNHEYMTTWAPSIRAINRAKALATDPTACDETEEETTP